jgi:hypothetical protein
MNQHLNFFKLKYARIGGVMKNLIGEH